MLWTFQLFLAQIILDLEHFEDLGGLVFCWTPFNTIDTIETINTVNTFYTIETVALPIDVF